MVKGKEPTVNITSPEDNAKFKVGDKVNISWVASNIPANCELTLEIQLPAVDPPLGDAALETIEKFNLTPGTTSFNWTAGSLGAVSRNNFGSTHYIFVEYLDENKEIVAYNLVVVRIEK